MTVMTTTEKANELVIKYRRLLPINLVTTLEVKQCALVAVDQIMNALEENGSWNYDYWNTVKQEIEKL